MSCCRSGSVIYLISFLALTAFGCTLAPKVSVSEEAAKSAASKLGEGMEGAAKEFGTELSHSTKPYQEELLARANDLTLSSNQLVQAARVMPSAFGEAVTDRLLKEKSFQSALRGVSVLAESPQHLASAVAKGPFLLNSKLEELQAELSKENGFVAQQRNALFDSFQKEREALTQAIRQERINAMNDLDTLTKHAIDEVFAQAEVLVRNALWLVIALILVLWGLPFVAGFFVGRLLGRKEK